MYAVAASIVAGRAGYRGPMRLARRSTCRRRRCASCESTGGCTFGPPKSTIITLPFASLLQDALGLLQFASPRRGQPLARAIDEILNHLDAGADPLWANL